MMLIWLAPQRKLSRAWLFITGPILVVGMIATGSRGPIVAVGVGALSTRLSTCSPRVTRTYPAASSGLSPPPVIRENPGGVYVRNWKLHAQAHYQFEYPHNPFLEVFSELGAPIGLGLVLALIVIGVVLVRPARTSPTSIGVLALLASETANVSVSLEAARQGNVLLAADEPVLRGRDPIQGRSASRRA